MNNVITVRIGEPDKLQNAVIVKQSAFVSFNYDAEIVAFIKSLSTRVYHPDTRTWEIPVQYLPKFCNTFNNDTIRISGIYKNISDRITSDIPSDYTFKTKPFPHQIDAVKFGLANPHWLLCDEQGVGKTKSVIDWIGCLDQIKPINKVLIVCGVNSIKYNWRKEISVHSDNDSWVLGTRFRKNGSEYVGGSKERLYDLDNLPEAKFIITNIESLRTGVEKSKQGNKTVYKFPIAEKIQELCDKGEISAIVFDEAHKCKDITSLQGRAMCSIKAEYMVALTGTPIMNSPLDSFFLLKWLGYENHSFYEFKMHYCVMGGFNGHDVVGYKNMAQLRSSLNAIMLRRLKSEVLDLPPKIRKIELVDMNAKQDILYKEVMAGIKTNINKIRFSANPLAMLIRLRQVTGCPEILSDKVHESAKLDRMEELVEELALSNQKCIIFSNWTEVTSVVKKRLAKYKPAYITGETKDTERMNEINRFQTDPSCKVIIGTIGAMGTGLTLTAAQTVIFLDSPWNRALKDQAEDRAHRVGTAGTVNIITICCKNTIDERIEALVDKKGAISDALVDGKMSAGDIDFLLS